MLALLVLTTLSLAQSPPDGIAVKEVEPLHVLVLPMRGPHRQLPEAFQKLVERLAASGIAPTGSPFARFYSGPPEVPEEDARWEAGFPVGAGSEASAPFAVRDIPGGPHAVLVQDGPHDAAGPAAARLAEWVRSHGYRVNGPPLLFFHGDPKVNGAGGPWIELRFPVEKVQSGAVPEITLPQRWAASQDLGIAVHSAVGPVRLLTTGHQDFKPSWSPDGSMLTFFRLHSHGSNLADFSAWRTSICVIRADGTGFRSLTSGDHSDFNPTWTRDGTNQVLFNRFSGRRNQAYRIDPAGAPGAEELISDPGYGGVEWVTGGLKDGRVFVDRIAGGSNRSFLLTPGTRKYEELRRPTQLLWHKLSISPSETRVAYMLDYDGSTATFADAEICHAELQLAALAVANQVCVTERGSGAVHEYPSWSRDESLLLYDSNQSGRYELFAHRLSDRTTARVASQPAGHNQQFASMEAVPR